MFWFVQIWQSSEQAVHTLEGRAKKYPFEQIEQIGLPKTVFNEQISQLLGQLLHMLLEFR